MIPGEGVEAYFQSSYILKPQKKVAIAIPFYLANPELTALHAERAGHTVTLCRIVPKWIYATVFTNHDAPSE